MLKPQVDSVSVLKWAARLWSLMIGALIVLTILNPPKYQINEGWPLSHEQLMYRVLFGICVVGMLMAWRWEVLGGWVTVAGMLLRDAIYLANHRYWMWRPGVFWHEHGSMLLGWAVMFALPGALFIMCGVLRHRHSSKMLQ